MNTSQKKTLTALVSHPVKWNCLLNQYTSFAIGGPANAVVTVDKRDELLHLLDFLVREKIHWRIIGRGTNLLINDTGFPGVMLILGKEYRTVSTDAEGSPDYTRVKAGGACSLVHLSKNCMAQGLTGLEFASGIPGTVGGSVIMNAGAWGNELSTTIESVTLVTPEGEQTIARKNLDFGYRCWKNYEEFDGKAIIAEVAFRLHRGDHGKIRERCRVLREKRLKSQPSGYANAGSFFKNPVNDSAGRLIEASGLKGTKIGGAMVSEKHANFFVNHGDATAADVLALMRSVQEKVKKDCGIDLEPEVHFI
jgi:UDP-N-acetylmuramate dehydrogenase